MTTKQFKLKEDQEHIQLNNLLQVLGLAQTGGHAKMMIKHDEVVVNEQIENRVRNKLVKGDIVKVEDHIITIE